MIDRLLYAATALALLVVFVFDPNFITNLLHAVDGDDVVLPQLNAWELGVGLMLLLLAVLAWISTEPN